ADGGGAVDAGRLPERFGAAGRVVGQGSAVPAQGHGAVAVHRVGPLRIPELLAGQARRAAVRLQHTAVLGAVAVGGGGRLAGQGDGAVRGHRAAAALVNVAVAARVAAPDRAVIRGGIAGHGDLDRLVQA